VRAKEKEGLREHIGDMRTTWKTKHMATSTHGASISLQGFQVKFSYAEHFSLDTSSDARMV